MWRLTSVAQFVGGAQPCDATWPRELGAALPYLAHEEPCTCSLRGNRSGRIQP